MKVYVRKGNDEVETTREVLKKANPKIGKSVLIKPNLTMPFSPETAICTSPNVVEGVIRYLQSIGINDIIIGEGAGGAKDMSNIFEATGYRKLADRYNLPLINLNGDKQVRLNIINGISLEGITVAKNVVDRYVINVPKMKTHRMAGVSLAMKNMIGCILPYDGKKILHPLYEEYVAKALKEKRNLTKEEFDAVQEEFFKRLTDFHSVCKPSLNVVDGFVAREGDGLNPNCGRNRKMNCVLVSESVPAIDFVASNLMGISLRDLYLEYVRGFDLSKIEIISDIDLDKLRKKFKPISLTERIIVY